MLSGAVEEIGNKIGRRLGRGAAESQQNYRDANLPSKGERGLWQRRYWEHAIRDERDYQRHLDYIHYNPVKHGYARAPHEWPHSSLVRWTERGFYSGNWAPSMETVELDLE